MKVIWTEEAKHTYFKNVEYLEKFWNEEIVEHFENETFHVIELLRKNPNLGSHDKKLGCSRIVIVEQITLYYDMIGLDLYIITFWDNHQKPLTYLDLPFKI